MISKEKIYIDTFCVSDTAGSSLYEELANDQNTRILEEHRHWENGDCNITVKYAEEQRVDESSEKESDGIPSYRDNKQTQASDRLKNLLSEN